MAVGRKKKEKKEKKRIEREEHVYRRWYRLLTINGVSHPRLC